MLPALLSRKRRRSAARSQQRRSLPVGAAACAAAVAIVAANLAAPVASAADDKTTVPPQPRGNIVWAATMQVGESAGLEGYSTLAAGAFGRLDATAFSRGETEHTVSNLLLNRSADNPSWSLLIEFSPPLDHGTESLSLRLGDLWLNLADARTSGGQHVWVGPRPAWRPGGSVTVALREFPEAFAARSIDGWGNNREQPELGTAGATLVRRAPVSPTYALTGGPPSSLPGARQLSNLLSAQTGSVPNTAGATDMVWQWGQFLDHDITLTPVASPAEPLPIPIPDADPVFGSRGAGTSMPLRRSTFDPSTGTSPDNPRAQINAITAFIDASNVYGSDPARARALRANDGSGQLKTSAGGRLLPYNQQGLPNDGGSGRQDLFLAGDPRANEQVGLIALHTLFVREHNRLARAIAAENPGLAGQQVFELARKIVGALMQIVTYNEFLPVLLGPHALGPYGGYDPGIDPSIANEFSAAAYRFGHSMLPADLLHIDTAGQRREVSLVEAFFNPSLLEELGISGFLRGLAARDAQQIDPLIVDEVRNMVFGDRGGPPRDLAALNIQRSRDHGIADYNSARVAYGLAPAASFAEVTSNPAWQQALRAGYGDIADLDLWMGGLAEDHLPGALVGETFHAIITDQFLRLRDGDRYWYENDPYLRAHPGLLEMLRGTTLADVIRRNTSISDEIPDRVLGDAAPVLAGCLRGSLAAGYSLVVYEGSTLEDLDSCMQHRQVSIVWTMRDSRWVRHDPAAGVHNDALAEFLASDAAPMTALLVWSAGPAPGDPAPDSPPRSWPSCFSGDMEPGLSLVAFEGGALEDLDACASAAGVKSAWTLDGSEFVRYVPGGPESVNRPFMEIFGEGVPYATPLVVRALT